MPQNGRNIGRCLLTAFAAAGVCSLLARTVFFFLSELITPVSAAVGTALSALKSGEIRPPFLLLFLLFAGILWPLFRLFSRRPKIAVFGMVLAFFVLFGVGILCTSVNGVWFSDVLSVLLGLLKEGVL